MAERRAARGAARLVARRARRARARRPRSRALREVTIVERDPEPLRARCSPASQDAADGRPTSTSTPSRSRSRPHRPAGARPRATARPSTCASGLTRYGPNLKVTRIGDDAFDRACVVPYPAELSEALPRRIQDEVLHEPDADRRAERLTALGARARDGVHRARRARHRGDVRQATPGSPVVLRLDASTIDLPWELARLSDGRVLGLEFALGRQVELGNIGRAAAWSRPRRAAARAGRSATPRAGCPARSSRPRRSARCLRDARRGGRRPSSSASSTTTTVSSKLDACSYDVLHYAGHAAYVEDRPEASGFVLADRKLLTPERPGDAQVRPAPGRRQRVPLGRGRQAGRRVVRAPVRRRRGEPDARLGAADRRGARVRRRAVAGARQGRGDVRRRVLRGGRAGRRRAASRSARRCAAGAGRCARRTPASRRGRPTRSTATRGAPRSDRAPPRPRARAGRRRATCGSSRSTRAGRRGRRRPRGR